MATLPDATALGMAPALSPGRKAIAGFDGGQVARAMQGAGQVLDEVAQRAQREDDANAVFAARRQLDDWERGAIFDPEKGAANKRGSAAFGIPDELGKSFDETAGKIAEGLTTDRQRAAFRELATSRRAQVLDWGSKHAQREREVYEVGQFKAELDSMAERAALFPDRAAGELDLARQRIIGFMRGKGRSTEEIEQAVKEQASRTHDFVLRSMVNAGNAEQASEYLKKNRGDMTAEAVLRAEAGLKETTARIRAQGFADEVFARGLSAEEAIKEARSKFTGVEEDAAVQELKVRFTDAETIKARDQKAASDAAWKVLANGGGRKGIAPELWNRLGGEEQRQIKDWLDAKWRQAQADANRETVDDRETYYRLRTMATEDPATFAGLDLMKYEPYLTKGAFARLTEVQAGISKNDAKAMEINRVVSSTVKTLKGEIAAAGLDTSPKEGSKQAKEFAMFMNQLTMALDDAGRQKGSPLTDMEARKIGMGLLREGIEQGSGVFGFFQTKKRGYQIAAEGDPAKTYVTTRYGDIPADIRKALEAELPHQYGGIYGRAAEREQQVERMYQRGLEQGRFR